MNNVRIIKTAFTSQSLTIKKRSCLLLHSSELLHLRQMQTKSQIGCSKYKKHCTR